MYFKWWSPKPIWRTLWKETMLMEIETCLLPIHMLWNQVWLIRVFTPSPPHSTQYETMKTVSDYGLLQFMITEIHTPNENKIRINGNILNYYLRSIGEGNV